MRKSLLIYLITFLWGSQVQAQTPDSLFLNNIKEYLQQQPDGEMASEYLKLKKVYRDTRKREVSFFFSTHLEYYPLREKHVQEVKEILKNTLQKKYKNYRVTVFVGEQSRDTKKGRNKWLKGYPYAPKQTIEELLPNAYRYTQKKDPKRIMQPLAKKGTVHVKNISRPYEVEKGLAGKHLALWHSHGWYYENKLDRWEWQRARVFQTVEDLLPMAFVQPFLVPMLENAGANVYLPRERDTQKHMVIVDNDDRVQGYQEHIKVQAGGTGFAVGKTPYQERENPFQQGTFRTFKGQTKAAEAIAWRPEIPETGEYAVYVSYGKHKSATTAATYTVHHKGGKTDFEVNQQMGAGTWVYLGTFELEKGNTAAVTLSTKAKGIVTADAVRFGGGMGDIARNGKLSGRARYLEGARYYMQFAGMPDTLVYTTTDGESDYRDDYRGRGEWVNYLVGAPMGPNKERKTEGLNIPIDLSLAFHTDAGHLLSDTTVGTLMIYSTLDAETEKYFPNGVSRYANRDLADIVQTQIVDDLRVLTDSIWTRRPMWDKRYSEAALPNVPSILLELLSHHNFQDMKFALDPNFRFDVSRAIYKGILKYMSVQHGYDYVVQPLAVRALSAEFVEEGNVKLSWKPTIDPLEPTALPNRYVVYTKKEGEGYDVGRVVTEPTIVLRNLDRSSIYSFKVTALNEGGESFPSHEIAACYTGEETVLVIDAFDRVSAPATIEAEGVQAFADHIDQGVAWGTDLSYIGSQYDYRTDSPWQDDDNPGHGASHADHETALVAGNTFNYALTHGQAICGVGYSFVSVSREAVEEGMVDLEAYKAIDIIFGEQKTTAAQRKGIPDRYQVFPVKFRQQLRQYFAQGGAAFLSGAYVGSDLFFEVNGLPKATDHPDILFARDELQMLGRTNQADRKGQIIAEDKRFSSLANIQYNKALNDTIYAVESPDGIEPMTEEGRTIARYSSNSISAGIAVEGASKKVILGFPFETIQGVEVREKVMEDVLRYLLMKNEE
ncbi:fibronectin type III domain-containing protein [Algivirga pacifica]|uniref:Xanthan lyase n=1 Tax=Algivirga pacifica TaxID=1162670 RepID=A0ABP9D788_9BACT